MGGTLAGSCAYVASQYATGGNQMPKPKPNKQYLTSGQLRARYGGRSDMWVGRIMRRDPSFPKPVRIGRFNYWALDEVEQYERAAVARRSRVRKSEAGRLTT